MCLLSVLSLSALTTRGDFMGSPSILPRITGPRFGGHVSSDLPFVYILKYAMLLYCCLRTFTILYCVECVPFMQCELCPVTLSGRATHRRRRKPLGPYSEFGRLR